MGRVTLRFTKLFLFPIVNWIINLFFEGTINTLLYTFWLAFFFLMETIAGKFYIITISP